MQTILITGANRGIGLELTRRYLARDATAVFATCRNPAAANDLNKLGAQYADRLRIISLDVTDPTAIAQSVATVRSYTDHLDLLINNAGTFAGFVGGADPRVSQFGVLEAEAMLAMLEINSAAPVMITQAYADLLRQAAEARVINLSSDAGSITQRDSSGNLTYGASKATLNMLTRCLAGDLRGATVSVIAIHPGFIQTDMGGPNAPLKPADTLPGVMQVIDNLTLADTGKFYNWDGTIVPW